MLTRQTFARNKTRTRRAKQRMIATAGLLIVALLLAGCSSCDVEGSLAIETAANAEAASSAGTTTYRTRLYEQLGLPGPSLTFEYPGNWHVAQEECRPQAFSEHVALESDGGHRIDLTFGNSTPSTSGYTTGVLEDVDFDPEPYPSLALPDSAPEYDRVERSDDEIRATRLQVRRWARPDYLGAGRGYYVTEESGADPYYYGRFQFMCIGVASQGTDAFTDDEKREVLQILGSLRQQPAPYDADTAETMAAAFRGAPGTYGHYEGDDEGHIFIDIWQLDANGSAANMGRMRKWDYTWRPTGERDCLGRPIILFVPTGDNPMEEPRELALDEEQGALCGPGDPEARYTR